jgi:hypothetical protein
MVGLGFYFIALFAVIFWDVSHKTFSRGWLLTFDRDGRVVGSAGIGNIALEQQGVARIGGMVMESRRCASVVAVLSQPHERVVGDETGADARFAMGHEIVDPRYLLIK